MTAFHIHYTDFLLLVAVLHILDVLILCSISHSQEFQRRTQSVNIIKNIAACCKRLITNKILKSYLFLRFDMFFGKNNNVACNYLYLLYEDLFEIELMSQIQHQFQMELGS